MELDSKTLCIFIQTTQKENFPMTVLLCCSGKKAVCNKYKRNMKYIEASEK
jgi:hypothetical protein